ncbi:hypothetical protein DESC_610248 [Desulfosarcina cetonica]|nr:hypothetical protein DESC_610248 [Desulfosarcina cetonica]
MFPLLQLDGTTFAYVTETIRDCQTIMIKSIGDKYSHEF